MLDGAILMWFILTAMALLFVIADIRNTPESGILKLAFVIVTAFTGPIGAFLYVLGCREPLPGLHEEYVRARWRQALGSSMHCVAGDGIGILTAAVIGGFLTLPKTVDLVFEYVLGFLFGWSIFQALFMRDMAGGSYARSLKTTFLPELLSMNCLMAGMIPVMVISMANVAGSHHPQSPAFWFIMCMALLTGFVASYPMNWWLVAHHLKHGMLTVHKTKPDESRPSRHEGHQMPMSMEPSTPTSDHNPSAASGVSARTLAFVTVLSFLVLVIGVGLAAFFGKL